MNTNINSFSFARMSRFIVADMYNRRTTLILLFALALFGTIALYIFETYSIMGLNSVYNGLDVDSTAIANLRARNVYSTVWSAMSLSMILYISLTFIPFFKRGYAAQNIMLPVSKCEKFLSRILDIVIVGIVLLAVVWLISAIYGMIVGATISFIPIKTLDYDDGITMQTRSLSAITKDLVYSACIAAFYFFGAAFWRKLHFIKTSAVIVGMVICVGIVDKFGLYNYVDFHISETLMQIIVGILSVLFVCLAWIRFSKTQIKG